MPMQTRFDFSFLEKSTEVLRAIAHPVRLGVIDLLAQHDQLSVTEIYEALQIEQAVASHHLRIMKDRGVVEVTRDGKNSLYSLTDPDYFQVVETLQKVL